MARVSGAVMALALASACTNSYSPSVGATDGPQVSPVSAALADAIGSIVAAARTHPVVAIGEIHRSAAIHSFLRSLLTDPRLPGVVDDIAVEFGASQNQGIVDRYVAGEDVPRTELQRVRSETSQTSGVWDSPLYEQFFDTIRHVNLDLPAGSRFRVLLMDTVAPPAECPTSDSCQGDLTDRDAHFAQVVEDQSLARGRHSLIVAGVGHVLRGNGRSPLSVTDRLESFSPGSAFVIIPNEGPVLEDDVIQGAVEGWRVPTLSPLAGSTVGRQPSSILHGDMIVTCDHPPCETPDYPGAIEEVADAYLYLGP
jgi:hypothetical protein